MFPKEDNYAIPVTLCDGVSDTAAPPSYAYFNYSNRSGFLLFYGRKLIFYLYLLNLMWAFMSFPFLLTNLTFLGLIIHMLYFEIELTGGTFIGTKLSYHSLGTFLLGILQPFSFSLSWTIGILDILLVSVMNPNLIEERAQKEHFSIIEGWLGNIWLHWLPPLFLTLDFYFHRDLLRFRLRLYPLFRFSSQNSEKENVQDSRPLLDSDRVPPGYGQYYSTEALVQRLEISSPGFSGQSKLTFRDSFFYIMALISTPIFLLTWQMFYNIQQVYGVKQQISQIWLILISLVIHMCAYGFWCYFISIPVDSSGKAAELSSIISQRYQFDSQEQVPQSGIQLVQDNNARLSPLSDPGF